jgi:predicted membrane chloride channel (bestrophin family)
MKPDDAKKVELEIYNRLSDLSKGLVHVKKKGVEAGLISRLHQYVSKMIVAYGIVRNVFYYRTPVALRAYSKVFIYLFPLIYGPYAASTYDDYSYGIAYVIAALYSVILVCLDNLQEDLENPFDQIGKDDVNFEVDELDQILNNSDNK